ncbi:Putative MIT domain-containing protein [Septoria linicola]|uniref:MIT domain-containing protein n=1 Tax=Septoria linicola TaxID=215465 RepID=A0A9Q9ELQ1_9PEZI|nr:putative MIT domain-containing protein [Septoria linicola]USW56011.1 Putative MIT domain-containing protein [Septoria linicola]
MFEANSVVSAPSASLLNQLQAQQRESYHRSTSLSSGSVATIKRPGSISRVPPSNPDDLDHQTLIPVRLSRDPMPTHDHRRRKSVAVDSETSAESFRAHSAAALDHEDRPPSSSSGLGTLNRWSHSNSSSVASLTNTRRNRSSGGAVLTSLVGQQYQSPRRPANIDASPRASPQRREVTASYASPLSSPERTRRQQSRHEHTADSLTALPPLHTTPALTDPNDTESPSTSSQTIPTPSATSYPHNDYFDDPLSAYGMAKQKRVVTVRKPAEPVSVPPQPTRAAPVAGSSQPEMAERNYHHRHRASGSGSQGAKKPKQKERMEKDKKTMLSKALQKANTAVLLDNAQNYEGALEAYGDACDLLTQVMERTSGEDDKRKLDAIRVTYSNRMEELRLLVQESLLTNDEKDLPARPMSDDGKSLPPPPVSPMYGAFESPHTGSSLEPHAQSTAPRLSYQHNDRDSFFSRTMAAVESSTNFAEGSGDGYTRRPSLASTAVAGSDTSHMRDPSAQMPPPEHAEYIPRPLSPKRPAERTPQSPTQQSEEGKSWESPEKSQTGKASENRNRINSKESTSWLDAVDESGSSCSASVHSRDSYHQGSRRKHLRDLSGETDPGFDEAFDAAVEAAYDEGLEPDLDSRRKRMTGLRQGNTHESVQVPASEIDEILPGTFQSALTNTEQDDEEERILDEITNDFGNEFNFGVTSKSALPRQSDSSSYSRSTWQSSQVSSRDTAASSLATVAEDGLGSRMSKPAALRESAALPAPSAPPQFSLPRPPSSDGRRASNVRSRRLSGMNAKQLKIETSVLLEGRKRASTFNTARSPMLQDEEETTVVNTPDGAAQEHVLRSVQSQDLPTVTDDDGQSFDEPTTLDHRPSYEESPADLLEGHRPMLFKKNRSTISLRDHSQHTVLLASPDPEALSSMTTPMSSTFMSFAAKRNPSQNPLTSQRANLPSLGHMSYDSQLGGGTYLFDTSLSIAQAPLSPRSPSQQPGPAGLEPCPTSFLLRPFWLMRALSSTIVHPRGGFLTDKLFVPREVWQTRGVKLKLVEDKVANCDLLTAALGRLAGVDTYDADAVKSELESFEEVMDRAQAALAKKLGSDVGPHGVTGMFKDASAANVASAAANSSSEPSNGADKAAKSNSGKSYLSSWRKLRNKSSGTPLSGGSALTPPTLKTDGKDHHTMPSVPMTSFVPVERRGTKREARNLVFEGPHRDYMGSLARLFDGVQILDQIARQVEDPGLRHSSPTHVGLELSIRHAAEFFGFYVCRFVLADLTQLMDKYIKRGTEWVLA